MQIGTSFTVRKALTILSNKMVNIAVVGAGVIGLSSAVNIQRLLPNAHVTVIADKFGSDTTTNGAGGFFRPCFSPAEKIFGLDRNIIEEWVTDSWKFYNSLATSPEAKDSGQMLVSGMLAYNTPKEDHYSLLADLAYDFHQLSEKEMKKRNMPYKYGYSFTTVVSETPKYMSWLTIQFKEAGGRVENRKVNSLLELHPQYDIVVNCCGLRADELVGDKEMYPVRGHLVMVDAPWMSHFFFSEEDIYMIPHSDKLIIGGVRQKGQSDLTPTMATREFILSRAQALFPQLKNARVLGDWVGLRPTRDKLRFELEMMDCGNNRKMPVFHNYGHAGHGITLGWGSGLAAARHVQEVVRSSSARL